MSGAFQLPQKYPNFPFGLSGIPNPGIPVKNVVRKYLRGE
jgi:hypothetical protein